MNAPIDNCSRFIADLAEALGMPGATPAALLREVVALKARTQPATDADLAEVVRLDGEATSGPWDGVGPFDRDVGVCVSGAWQRATLTDRVFMRRARTLLPTLARDLANCRRLIRQHKAAAMGTDSRAAWEVAEELWRAVP